MEYFPSTYTVSRFPIHYRQSVRSEAPIRIFSHTVQRGKPHVYLVLVIMLRDGADTEAHPQIWQRYKKAKASFWTAEGINLSMNDNEHHFISLSSLSSLRHRKTLRDDIQGIFPVTATLLFTHRFHRYQEARYSSSRAIYG